MQAVLLAAGNSSRLHPFGGSTHKSTIEVMGKSLLQRTIEGLVTSGVTEIIIVDSKGNGVKDCLDSFSPSVPVRLVSHEGARGMGEALLEVREYLNSTFLLTHAHHVDVSDHISKLTASMSEDIVTLLVKKEENLSAYGGVRLGGDSVLELVEKPSDPHSLTHKVIGMYSLNEHFLNTLEKTPKAHYSFEDALCSMIKSNAVKAVETSEDVLSLKYPFHLFDIVSYVFSKTNGFVSPTAEISDSAILEGNIVVEDNVRIYENAVIKGPAYLGKGSIVGTNAVIRDGVSLEEGVKVGANMEIKHSLIGKHTTTHSGFLGDCIVGEGTKLAASFISGNVRLDRKEIGMIVKGEKVLSGHNHLGAFIGRNVRIGINVSTMPGVVIGSDSFVGPHTVVFHNVESGSTFYSKFQDVILKPPASSTMPPAAKERNTYVLFDIDYTLFDTGTFKESELKEYILYEEVVEAVQTLSGVVTLGIFSQGDVDFQKSKLVKTMIHDHFVEDHVHIVSDKHATIASIVDQYRDETLILVDDRLEILQEAKSLSGNVTTIWVKRGPFADAADTSVFTPDYTVSTLRDVLKIVTNL